MLATQRYFKTIQAYLDDLRKPSQKMQQDYSKFATWYDSFAQKIEQLPTYAVDEDVAKYGKTTAYRLRAMAGSLRGDLLDVKKLEQSITITPYVYATSGWGRRLQPGVWLQSNQAEVQGKQQEADPARRRGPAGLVEPDRQRHGGDRAGAGGAVQGTSAKVKHAHFSATVQRHRRGRVFGAFAFARRQDHERLLARLDPRLRVQHDSPRRYVRRHQDAVQPDIEHAHAVRQAADIERNSALEAVAALDRHIEIGFLPRLNDDLALTRRRHDVAGVHDRRLAAVGGVLDFLAVDHGPADEFQLARRRRFRVRIGPQGEGRRHLVGFDPGRGGVEPGRQPIQSHFDRAGESVGSRNVDTRATPPRRARPSAPAAKC